MNDLIIWFFLLLVFPLVFFLGYYLGKKARKIDLAGKGPQEAFAYFLMHEIQRHRRDIEKGKADLKNLKAAGFTPPDIPLGLWIRVKK